MRWWGVLRTRSADRAAARCGVHTAGSGDGAGKACAWDAGRVGGGERLGGWVGGCQGKERGRMGKGE